MSLQILRDALNIAAWYMQCARLHTYFAIPSFTW